MSQKIYICSDVTKFEMTVCIRDNKQLTTDVCVTTQNECLISIKGISINLCINKYVKITISVSEIAKKNLNRDGTKTYLNC